MNCRQAERRLPGYLDGAISTRDHALLRAHLSSCDACRHQLDDYRRLSSHLAQVEVVAAPLDLAWRIRAQASRVAPPWDHVRRLWARAVLVFENILEPLAVPATGGILTALAAFILLVHSVIVGMPLGGIVPNDPPLNTIQPARLESLAPFPVSGAFTREGRPDSGVLLVEATLNSQGQVVYYKVVSGASSPLVERQLDQVLLFSRFRPQFSFGRPTDGGRVMISFSEVHVRG
ncbi:MAG: anti-sigma factor family protein [Candidatus Acidiferrales bacterium]